MFTGQLGTVQSTPGTLVLGLAGDTGLNADLLDFLSLTETFVGRLDSNLFSDNLALDEFYDRRATYFRSTSDTLVLSDSFIPPVRDDLVFTESYTVVKMKIVSFTDIITLNETFARQLSLSVRTVDTIVPIESFRANRASSQSWSDLLSLVEQHRGNRNLFYVDTLSFTEIYTVQKIKTLQDLIEFNEFYTRNISINRTLFDPTPIYDLFQVTLFLRRSLSDSLTLSDQFNGIVARSTSDVLVLNDNHSAIAVKPLYDTIILTDTYARFSTRNLSIADLMIFLEAYTTNFINNSAQNDALILTDSYNAIKSFSVSYADTLTLTDMLLRSFIPTTLNEALTITDVYTQTKANGQGVSDSIEFIDSFTRQATFSREINDTVLLNDNHLVYLGGTGVFLDGLRSIIQLPSPKFNDFQLKPDRLVVRKSISGKHRTFVRTTDRERTNWTFELPKPLADDLQVFIDNEINNEIIITDIQGRFWKAFILTDSIDFTETRRWAPCGNAVRVTFEWEGRRYAGNNV